MKNIIQITENNIESEHICCAFSDKKCQKGYALKKDWLKNEFNKGYVFRRIDERAKVFIEYVAAELAWAPISAPNYLLINCLWVSGQYKGHGYAKQLLQYAIDDAKNQGKDGLVTIVGTKKFHFMNDTKWFLEQGFETVQKTDSGFSLLVKKFNSKAKNPSFNKCTLNGECDNNDGITVYYSNRCPFTEYYVNDVLTQTAEKRNIPLKIIKLETMEDAQACPSPATIFSLFYKGKFVTTDVSVCLDNRFDKSVKV